MSSFYDKEKIKEAKKMNEIECDDILMVREKGFVTDNSIHAVYRLFTHTIKNVEGNKYGVQSGFMLKLISILDASNPSPRRKRSFEDICNVISAICITTMSVNAVSLTTLTSIADVIDLFIDEANKFLDGLSDNASQDVLDKMEDIEIAFLEIISIIDFSLARAIYLNKQEKDDSLSFCFSAYFEQIITVMKKFFQINVCKLGTYFFVHDRTSKSFINIMKNVRELGRLVGKKRYTKNWVISIGRMIYDACFAHAVEYCLPKDDVEKLDNTFLKAFPNGEITDKIKANRILLQMKSS